MARSEPDPIDWSLTTWEGSEREQLRRWAALSLEDILRAQQEMRETTEKLHATGAAGGAACVREGLPAPPCYPQEYLASLDAAGLIELMIGDEDRVPRSVIDACVRHGDRMVEALGALDAPYDPEEEDPGAWWLRLHAVMILGLIPTEAAGLLALRLMRLASEMEDGDLQDWLSGYWPDLLAHKPDAVLNAAREVCADRSLDWYARANALDPVVASAHRRGPEALDAELDRLALVAADEAEDWDMRLSCAHLLLDFPRARHRALLEKLASLQRAPNIGFVGADVEEAYAVGDSPEWGWHNDPWQFYRPEAIAERQARWAREERERKDDPGLEDEEEPFRDNAPYARSSPKVGRNDPCPCGSGKKFKKCCLGTLSG